MKVLGVLGVLGVLEVLQGRQKPASAHQQSMDRHGSVGDRQHVRLPSSTSSTLSTSSTPAPSAPS